MPSSQHVDIERLLDELNGVQVDQLQGVELRGLLIDLERARNAFEAVQAQVMVAMLREAQAADSADHIDFSLVPTGAREEFVIDEIAVELRCTRVAASHRFGVAFSAAQHPAILEAWRSGRLDARKLQIITDGLVGSDPVFIETVTASAVDYAAAHTGPQVRAWLARRVIAQQPHAAEIRRQSAMQDRRVVFAPLADGMAELSAVMPAIQARHLYETVNALGHAADASDARTLDQRRSDALYDLVTGRADSPSVHLNVVAPATLVIGEGNAAPELAGYGPLASGAIRDLVVGDELFKETAAVTWRALLVDDVSGVLTDVAEPRYRPSARLDHAVRARDVTCRFPGCRRSATTPRSGVDLDHTVPWPGGDTEATNLACLCRHHHRLKHAPGWQLAAGAGGSLHWTTPSGRQFVTRPWSYLDPPGSQSEDR